MHKGVDGGGKEYMGIRQNKEIRLFRLRESAWVIYFWCLSIVTFQKFMIYELLALIYPREGLLASY